MKKCSAGWVQKLNQNKTQALYKKNQNIFLAGQMVLGLHFIQSGKVKVTSSGNNNREQIVRLAGDGHILGHRGYGKDVYPVNAVALVDSVVCFVDNNLIYTAFLKNPVLTYHLMIFYANELREVEHRLQCQMQMDVKEKVIHSLLYLIRVYGLDSTDSTLPVYISRKEMAELSGISSDEQVVRILNDLSKERLIKKSGKKIKILNEDKMQKLMEPFGLS